MPRQSVQSCHVNTQTGTCNIPPPQPQQVAPNVPPLGRPYGERRCCGGPLEQLEWMMKTHSAPSVSCFSLADAMRQQ